MDTERETEIDKETETEKYKEKEDSSDKEGDSDTERDKKRDKQKETDKTNNEDNELINTVGVQIKEGRKAVSKNRDKKRDKKRDRDRDRDRDRSRSKHRDRDKDKDRGDRDREDSGSKKLYRKALEDNKKVNKQRHSYNKQQQEQDVCLSELLSDACTAKQLSALPIQLALSDTQTPQVNPKP